MMKKIISLLSVFAIVCTMFTTVSFAAGNRIYFEESKSGNTVALTMVADMTEGASNISGQIDLTDVFAAGVTAKVTSTTAGITFKVVNTKKAKCITFTALDTDASDKYVGKVVFGTVEFDFTNATTNSIAFKELKALQCRSATEGDREIQNDAFTYVLAKEADEGFKPAAGGNMVNPATGKTEQTYLTDIVEFNTDETAPSITIKDEAGETKTFDGDWYPTNLKGQGTIKVLVIVRYAGATEKTFSIVNE